MKHQWLNGILWLGLAALSFFLLASSSPQCAKATDPELSLTTQDGEGNPCVFACQDEFKIAKKNLQEDYRAAKAACEGNLECLEEAEAIRDALNEEIVGDKNTCVEACNHQQGTATGGQ